LQNRMMCYIFLNIIDEICVYFGNSPSRLMEEMSISDHSKDIMRCGDILFR